MSDEDLMVDGRPLSSLKVTELKEELEKRQIFIKGVKAVLQEKLREAIAAQGDSAIEASLGLRERTESEASGTKTPQSNASPAKKPDSSPSKRQTPKRGQKASQSKEETEVVEIQQNEQTAAEIPQIVQKEADDKTEKRSETSEKSNSSEMSEKIRTAEHAEVTENGKNSEAVHHDKHVEVVVTPQWTELKEAEQDTQSRSPVKEEVREEKVINISPKKQEHKEDDGDELDYGDDDDRDAKDGESRDSEEEEKAKMVQVEEKNEKKDEDVKKEEKVRGPVSHRRVSSPSSRHPVSNIVHIRGLTRPFTERQLRSEIEKHGGEIVDFWIDKVKSHCFAKLNTDTDAGKVLKTMHDTIWPDGNPKKLAIVFESEENMTKYKEGRESTIVEAGKIGGRADRVSTTSQASLQGGKASLHITLQNVIRDNDKLDSERKEKRGNLASRLTRIDDNDKISDERKRKRSETPPFSRGAGFMDEKKSKHEEREGIRKSDHRREDHGVVEEEVPKKTLDQLFKKTVAHPPIYYLPLTEEQVADKLNQKKMKESEKASERAGRSDRDRERERDRSRGERNDRGDRGDRPRRRD